MSSVLGFYAPDQENGYLSNWYSCSFKCGRYTYSSAEQFMMAQKAALFHDIGVLFKILDTTDRRKSPLIKGGFFSLAKKDFSPS